jgi:hypothetical protein
MSEFQKEYQRLCEIDRKITEEMVRDGELTEEEGYIRNDFRRLEILMEMEDNIEGGNCLDI